MTYSLHFRHKVLREREAEGLTILETAERFRVGVASVTRWLKEVKPKKHGHRRRKVDQNALEQDVRDYPDAYQHERAERFGVCQNAICHGLKKLGVTHKKNAEAPQVGRGRPASLSR